MGDSLKEIEDVLAELQHFAPLVTRIIGTLLPQTAPALAMASPVLQIATTAVKAVEDLKATGVTHESAVTIIANAFQKIGMALHSTNVPAPAGHPAPTVTSIPAINFAERIG